jgi:UDP-glucose 4-epimerase
LHFHYFIDAMKILFTGSSGPKVGATVAAHLAKFHDVVGIDLAAGMHTKHLVDIASIVDWSTYVERVDAIIHFAALHAPHRETHSRAQFFDTNVHATARLIDAAKLAGVKRFVMASSTSVYGRAMRSTERAVWVTEELMPIAEDIYDETKLAGEALCRDNFAPNFVTTALRFSRSFPEPLPLMAQYRLHRGVDARDVAAAFLLALGAPLTQFETFNISGDTPFLQTDCDALMHNAPSVLQQRAPDLVEGFSRRGWALPQSIDRVYVIDKAKAILGYEPQYGWNSVLNPDSIF